MINLGVQVLVATPGRLNDLIQVRAARLNKVVDDYYPDYYFYYYYHDHDHDHFYYHYHHYHYFYFLFLLLFL